MNIDHLAIYAAARRDRALAINQYLFAPVAALFRRLARPAPRRTSTTFPAARGC
jgi:hypothetical protein